MANNPMFNEAAFKRAQQRQSAAPVYDDDMRPGEQPLRRTTADAMTFQGTISKSFFLLLISVITATFSWMHPNLFSNAMLFFLLFAGFAVGIWTSFMPVVSPFTAPLYALIEGFLLGGISVMYNQYYNGIVLQAVMLTALVFSIMLFVYKTGIIKVTQRLVTGITSATAAVAIFYLVSLLGTFFGLNIDYITSSSPLSIVLSVVICIIAAFNFLLDFKFIDVMCQRGDVPRFMEWYAGFGLLVTFIWLYVEILKLLSKTNRR